MSEDQKVDEKKYHYVMENIDWDDNNHPRSWDVVKCDCDRPWRHQRLSV